MPVGHQLPLPAWLEPTRQDIEDAERTGRPAGLSVWDVERTSRLQACRWRQVDPSTELAFAAGVATIRQIGEAHERALDVVADPLDTGQPAWANALLGVPNDDREAQRRSAEGHSLVEGLRRPESSSKKQHRDLRDELA